MWGQSGCVLASPRRNVPQPPAKGPGKRDFTVKGRRGVKSNAGAAWGLGLGRQSCPSSLDGKPGQGRAGCGPGEAVGAVDAVSSCELLMLTTPVILNSQPVIYGLAGLCSQGNFKAREVWSQESGLAPRLFVPAALLTPGPARIMVGILQLAVCAGAAKILEK